MIDESAAAPTPAFVLTTAGFAAPGGSGRSLDQHLHDNTRRHGIRLIGPNCCGLMTLDPAVRLNATYTPAIPPAGRVAIASEGGGRALAAATASPRLDPCVSRASRVT